MIATGGHFGHIHGGVFGIHTQLETRLYGRMRISIRTRCSTVLDHYTPFVDLVTNSDVGTAHVDIDHRSKGEKTTARLGYCSWPMIRENLALFPWISSTWS
jgi:hypothetical protein